MKASFESTLWDEVRQAVRDDPDLRFWGHFNWIFRAKAGPYWLIRPVFSWFVVAFFTFGIVVYFSQAILPEGTRGESSWDYFVLNLFLTWAVNFWIFAGASGLAFALAILPSRNCSNAFLQLLPISDSGIYQWSFKWVWQELLIGPIDLVIAFSIIAFSFPFSWFAYLLLLLLIPLNRLYTFSLAILVAMRFPLRGVWLYTFLATIQFPVLFLHRMQHPIPDLENLLLPTAYPLILVQLLEPRPDWKVLLYLIPICLVISTLPDSLKRLQRRFIYSDFAPILKPTEEPVSENDLVRRRPLFQKGPVERTLWKWFTPQQKSLTPFLFPKDVNLTLSWAAINGVFFILLALVLLLWPGESGNDLVNVISALSFLMILASLVAGIIANLFSFGPVGRVIEFSGLSIHLFSTYPIIYWEMVLVLLKYTLIQLPLFAPISVASAAFIATLQGHSPFIGAVKGLEFCLSLLGTRLVCLTMGINSFARMNWYWYYLLRYIVFNALGVIVMLVMLAIAGFGLVAPFILWDGDESGSITLSFLSLVLGYICISFNRAIYRLRIFDLVSSVPQSPFRLNPNQLPWERSF